jgi:hypothetical protein
MKTKLILAVTRPPGGDLRCPFGQPAPCAIGSVTTRVLDASGGTVLPRMDLANSNHFEIVLDVQP